MAAVTWLSRPSGNCFRMSIVCIYYRNQCFLDLAEVFASLFLFNSHRSGSPRGVFSCVLIMIQNYSKDLEDGSNLQISFSAIFYPILSAMLEPGSPVFMLLVKSHMPLPIPIFAE